MDLLASSTWPAAHLVCLQVAAALQIATQEEAQETGCIAVFIHFVPSMFWYNAAATKGFRTWKEPCDVPPNGGSCVSQLSPLVGISCEFYQQSTQRRGQCSITVTRPRQSDAKEQTKSLSFANMEWRPCIFSPRFSQYSVRI